MSMMRQSLGKPIRRLELGGNVRVSNHMLVKCFTNRMTKVNVNSSNILCVLDCWCNTFNNSRKSITISSQQSRALMKDQIDINLNSTSVISMKRSKSRLRNTTFT